MVQHSAINHAGVTGVPNVGTSMPGSPATNQRIYRTDLAKEFYYDGTRWLSTQVYHQPLDIQDQVTPTTVSGSTGWAILGDGTYDLWVTRVLMWTFVATTNDGTKFWTITVNRHPSNTAISGNVSTNADTVNTATRHNVTVGALTGTSDKYLALACVKTSTPGALYVNVNLEYRIVGT